MDIITDLHVHIEKDSLGMQVWIHRASRSADGKLLVSSKESLWYRLRDFPLLIRNQIEMQIERIIDGVQKL